MPVEEVVPADGQVADEAPGAVPGFVGSPGGAVADRACHDRSVRRVAGAAAAVRARTQVCTRQLAALCRCPECAAAGRPTLSAGADIATTEAGTAGLDLAISAVLCCTSIHYLHQYVRLVCAGACACAVRGPG